MCSHQLGTANVADHNVLVGVHDMARELMTGIQPAATNLPMQALRLSPMTAPLQGFQAPLGVSVETNRIQPLAVAGYCDVLDTKIDTNRGSRSYVFSTLDLDSQTQPPITD